MKIKTDFITNSSSTVYIVFIPSKFFVDNSELQKISNKKMWYPELMKPEIFDKIAEYIGILKGGDNIWYYGDDGVDPDIFGMIVDICRNYGFVIATLDIDGEGNNIVRGIREEKINKILVENIDILSIFKLIHKGGNDVSH